MTFIYSKYGYFGRLCEVPINVLNNLQEVYNDIELNRSADMNTGYYKQWYIQKPSIDNPMNHNDSEWFNWNDEGKLDQSKTFFKNYVKEIYRFRFSYLEKQSNVDYHSRHPLPRIHIPLNDSDAKFEVMDDKDNTYSYHLTYGYAHFINVTFKHRVVGSDASVRKNSFFSFENFSDIKLSEQFLHHI